MVIYMCTSQYLAFSSSEECYYDDRHLQNVHYTALAEAETGTNLKEQGNNNCNAEKIESRIHEMQVQFCLQY